MEPPLGIMEIPYTIESVSFTPGSQLIMYTDSITEATNPAGDLYGEQRLEALVAQGNNQDAATLKKEIVDSVSDFTSGIKHLDDVTLAIVEYAG